MALLMSITATSITLSGNAQEISVLGDMFAANYNYQTQVLGSDGQMVPNPETKPQFVKRIVSQYFKDQYKVYKINAAVAQAKLDAAPTSIIDIS